MKHKILIVPDKHGNDPTARLRCRVRWSDNVWAMNVGYKITLAKWSYDSQRVKANTTHDGYSAATINRAIETLINNIESCFEHYDLANIIPTLAEMKDYYASKYSGKAQDDNKPKTIIQLLDRFVIEASRERDWSQASNKKFTTIRNHISSYKDCQLASLDDSWLNGLIVHMIDNLNLINSTVEKYIGCMRWMLSWADKHALVPPVWRAWKPKLKTAQNKVIFLTWEELMSVYLYPLEWDYQKRVRDVFCLCSFTGLRYSDAQNLKKSDIGDDLISITSIKDHEQLNININKYARTILDRYKNCDGDKALPVVSNQKYNNYIKEVMQICGITSPISTVTYQGNKRIETTRQKWQCVTTHTARKTFVCNALMLGIIPEVVMKWTGHSDYRAMKPYIDIADSLKKSEMDKFNVR